MKRIRPRPRKKTVNWPAIGSTVSALTAIGALVFTGLSLNATRDQVALAEQGQATDRYSKAVEQIGRPGPENLLIRLGGIYALERLSRDSQRDQPTVVEVLSAFVRTTTAKPKGTCPDDAPAADVEAALTVLMRRDSQRDGSARIDLRGACLRRVDLSVA